MPVEKKGYGLSRLHKFQVTMLLHAFIENRDPKYFKYNPTLREYNDQKLTFGMSKHYGGLVISSDGLWEKLPKMMLEMTYAMWN